MQSGGLTGPLMEQATLPGATSAHDIRLIQWQQQQQQQVQQQQQQQLQQQQQKALQQAKLQQQQQELQAAPKKADSPAVCHSIFACIHLIPFIAGERLTKRDIPWYLQT
jgi:hypothetical protein